MLILQGDYELCTITNYDLHFEVEPEKGFFNSQGTITILNDTKEAFKKLSIMLYHDLNVKNIRNTENESLAFLQEKVSLEDEENYLVNYITISLSEALQPNEQINISIEYEGSLNGYSKVMAYVKDKIHKEFSILRPDCHAYPIIAEPSFISILKSYENKFTYNILVKVPKVYKVACGGVLRNVTETNDYSIFNYASVSSTWRFDITAADYSIVEDKDSNLKIFVFPEHKANAENIVIMEIRRTFELFEDLFGDFQEGKHFTVIEVKESYGSQAGDNYILMEEHGFSGDAKKLTHLYHEVGHAWNVKAKHDIQRTRFFDEAFASYFEALAIKKFYRYKEFTAKMDLYRNLFIESVNADKINFSTPICNYGKYEIGHNSYTKGPWVLYLLNEILGDEVFYKAIRNFLNKFRDKEVDFEDFREAIEEVSNIDLSVFFKKWIYGIESSEFLYSDVDVKHMINNYKSVE
ncbi:M1 family metallopeptidase [Clostridium tunisiense]|uniref:M1 family metallopeptidase n=1 Tax=Clostridium tunisiense TaxID=219748 RepID=UPI000A01080A|nr:M1 family aminopeptidase [Clostridium tunisiense]